MDLPNFLGGTASGRSISADSQQTMNFYPEIRGDGAKGQVILIGTPGLKLYGTVTSNAGPCRGFFTSGGNRFFVAVGTEFIEIDNDGAKTVRGTLTTKIGYVTMAENVNLTTNTTQIMVVDGVKGYIFELSDNTFTDISGVASSYEAGTHVIYKDGVFIQNISGTNKFAFSTVGAYDGKQWNTAIDYYAAETNADSVDAIAKINNEIYIFGSKSIEIWYATGDSNDPFARINNAYIDIGIEAKYSIGTINNTLFWLGSNGQGANIVWMANSYVPQRISDHNIEYLISQISSTNDAVGYCYQQEGHYFYVLSFQGGNKTIVYDMTTGLWHERGYYNEMTGNNDRHRGICHAFWNKRNMIGDYENGNIYYFDLNQYTDNGNIIKRWRTSPHYYMEGKTLFFRELDIETEKGVGTNNYYEEAANMTTSAPQIIEHEEGIDEHTEGIDEV